MCFASKKLSKMELEFILKVEVEVEVGVFSLCTTVNYGIKLWRGPQPVQNTLGGSYLVDGLLFRCTKTLPKGLDSFLLVWNTSRRVQEGILAPNGA